MQRIINSTKKSTDEYNSFILKRNSLCRILHSTTSHGDWLTMNQRSLETYVANTLTVSSVNCPFFNLSLSCKVLGRGPLLNFTKAENFETAPQRTLSFRTTVKGVTH